MSLTLSPPEATESENYGPSSLPPADDPIKWLPKREKPIFFKQATRKKYHKDHPGNSGDANPQKSTKGHTSSDVETDSGSLDLGFAKLELRPVLKFHVTETEAEDLARSAKKEEEYEAKRKEALDAGRPWNRGEGCETIEDQELMQTYIPRCRAELYKHLYGDSSDPAEVVALGQDGNLQITDDTELVSMMRPRLRQKEGAVLANMMSKTSPAQICQININQELYPALQPGLVHNSKGCNLRLRFNKLLMAPCVCLELALYDPKDAEKGRRTEPYHVLSVEFPWSPDPESANRGCIDYALADAIPWGAAKGCRWMTFFTGFALCKGFQKALAFRDHLSPADIKLIKHLYSLVGPHDIARVDLLIQNKPPPPPRLDPKRKLMNGPVLGANDEEHSEPKFETDPLVTAVRSVLPGGEGVLLPTLFKLAYPFFRAPNGDLSFHYYGMFSIIRLLHHDPPHPFMSVQSSTTFTNAEDAAVVHARLARGIHMEQKEQLRLWASVTHQTQIFKVGRVAVLVVKFSPFPKLSTHDAEISFRMHAGTEASMEYAIKGPTFGRSRFRRFKGFATPGPIGNLPRGDAYFIVSYHTAEYFKQDAIDVEATKTLEEAEHAVVQEVKFKPSINEATYRAQRGAAMRITEVPRWHPLICAWFFRIMDKVDLLRAHLKAGDAHEATDQAIARLYDTAINDEQTQAIKSLETAQNSYAIILGTAGTGKTHLQLALATFYASVGCRVLALAPTNANCDDFSNKLAAYPPFQKLSECVNGPQLIRLYPYSSDYLPKDMAFGGPSGPDNEKSFEYGLEAVLASHRLNEHLVGSHKARLLGLQQRTLNEAKKGGRELYGRDRDHEHIGSHGEVHGEVNHWRKLQEHIVAIEQDEFDASDYYKRCSLTAAYNECRTHLMQTAAVVSTTTANSNCDFLKRTWFPDVGKVKARPPAGYYKGLVILVDEATRDLEINLLIPMMEELYHDKITAVIHFGDDKQLGPVNTAICGPIQTVEFRAYGDMPLPKRLVEEGFPTVTRLQEQCRMHPTLADFPGRAFYDGKMRSASRCNTLLKDIERGTIGNPSLVEALLEIFKVLGVTLDIGAGDAHDVDSLLRDLHIVVKGKCLMHPDTHSKVVLEVANFFLQHMWPILHKVYKGDMSKEIMIVCGYKETKNHWNSAIAKTMLETRLDEDNQEARVDRDHFPSVQTIDNSQGQEATVVIIDTAVQRVDYRSDMGFLNDIGRVNVALTRARECRMMIAGDYEGKLLEKEDKEPTGKIPVLVKFYREQREKGRVMTVPAELVEQVQCPPHLVDAVLARA